MKLHITGKKIILIIGLLTFIVSVGLFLRWCLLGGLEKKLVADYSEPQSQWQEVRGPLIKTQWEQNGPYTELAPDKTSLGCWSVAFAQVLAFHHRQPTGRVTYKTSQGILIDEIFDRPISWDNIDVARYIFDTAVVVQKDFGREEYMDIGRIPEEITEHYGVTVEKIISGLQENITSELEAGRPVIVYFDNILGIARIVPNGHAAIFDGTAENNGRLFVHVNFGWGGASDGWYDFEKLAKERELQYVFRVMP
jgi:hypothetical protein